jgi:hypothetical protein
VYLANPPAQELFRDEFAWEVTHEQESLRRRRSEPFLYALSGGIKTFRQRFLKRDKMATLVGGLIRQAARSAEDGASHWPARQSPREAKMASSCLFCGLL